MQFINTLLALTGLTLAAANTVEFLSLDSTTRNIVFTPSAGLASIDTIVLEGHGTANVTFPSGWIGNWYSYNDGAVNVPGMLGEVTWNGWAGSNYFDVSAIVDPNDTEGVKMLYPKFQQEPVSGCMVFPCSNAYMKPDDIQTLSTTDDTIVCLVGNPITTKA